MLISFLLGIFFLVPVVYLHAAATAEVSGGRPAAGYSAICAVSRDDNLYIREWVEYHTQCLGK